MLHVLRHYLPLRKAILIVSETVLITLVVFGAMSAHLLDVDDATLHVLARESLDPSQAFWRVLLSASLIAVLSQVAISFNELYDFRISGSRYDRAARFLGSAGSAIVLSMIAFGLADVWELDNVLDFPGLPFSQAMVLLAASLGLAFVLLYFWRNVFHAAMRQTHFNQRLLVIGSGRMANRMVEELESREQSGYEIVAMISPARGERRRSGDRRRAGDGAREELERGTGNPWFDAAEVVASAPPLEREEKRGPRLVARSSELEGTTALRTDPEPSRRTDEEPLLDVVARHRVSDIVVAFEDRRGQLPTAELLRCRMAGIVVHEAEAFFEQLTGKIPAEAMRPSYLIFNKGFLQNPLAQLGKRLFDVAFGIVVFACVWPLMILAAIAIRLDDPGPVLFKQERTGQDGKPFTLCKFRSMRVDAEKLTGPVWAQANDPRITRIGRFLRKTRIDELPQLFNVLAGSMSFVGPRPERPSFVEDLAEKIPYYHQRHIVKPGLTGWAQINYPYGNTVEDALQKLQYDLFYIKYQSLLFDLSIVANTVKTVVLRKGT